MSSLADFDPDRPVPLRFNHGSRPRGRAAVAPVEPANPDLAAELEAALMRDLSVVEHALPPAGKHARPARQATVAEASPTERPRKPSPNLYAPMPKRVLLSTDPVTAGPTEPEADAPVSPYAPPPRRIAAREPARSEPVSRRPVAAPAQDNMVPPDWLTSEEFDEEPVWAVRPKRSSRPYIAVAALVGVVICGGAFVGLRPAVAPAGDAAAAPVTLASVAAPARPEAQASVPAIVTPAPQPAEASAVVDPPLSITASAGAGSVAPPPPSVAAAAQSIVPVEPAPDIAPEGAANLMVADLAPTLQPNPDDQVAPVSSAEAAAPVVAKLPAKKNPGGKASITTAVNMRFAPDNTAAAVKVLAGGTRVDVISCNLWCEIVAGGKHGYVFKRFLVRS